MPSFLNPRNKKNKASIQQNNILIVLGNTAQSSSLQAPLGPMSPQTFAQALWTTARPQHQISIIFMFLDQVYQ